jgi:chemotaxis protein CheD
MSKIIVGVADYAVARKPTRLITMGLGSCVGISLYDPYTQIGGLVHIMLPSIDHARSKDNKAKFADTGIAYLMEEMQKEGAMKRRVVAKIAGGASMFSFTNESNMNIGERNVEMTKKVLDDHRTEYKDRYASSKEHSQRK